MTRQVQQLHQRQVVHSPQRQDLAAVVVFLAGPVAVVIKAVDRNLIERRLRLAQMPQRPFRGKDHFILNPLPILQIRIQFFVHAMGHHRTVMGMRTADADMRHVQAAGFADRLAAGVGKLLLGNRDIQREKHHRFPGL